MLLKSSCWSTSLVLGIVRFLIFCQSEGYIPYLWERQQPYLTLSHWEQSWRISLDRKGKGEAVAYPLYMEYENTETCSRTLETSGSDQFLYLCFPRLKVTTVRMLTLHTLLILCPQHHRHHWWIRNAVSLCYAGRGRRRWPSIKSPRIPKLISFLLCLCSNALS